MADTRDFERMEQDGWSDPAVSKGYADGFDMATRHVAQDLCRAVTAGPGMRALDLCCGHGVVSAALADAGAQVKGLDFSPAMIALARRLLPGLSFVQGDAMAMDFDDHSFDVVTIGFGVPHFPDPAAGLAEVARVLRPGGRLAFSIWHGAGSQGAFDWLFAAVARHGDPRVVLPAGPDAHQLTDPDIAIPLVAGAGFEDVRLASVNSRVQVRSPHHLFDIFDRGAVRAASLLGGQSPAIRAAIRADLAAQVVAQGVKGDHGHIVPVPSVIVSAVRA